MKIIYVRSGNRGIDPITQNQGFSLINKSHEVYFYDIFGKGFLGYVSNIMRLRKQIKLSKPDIIHSHYSLSGFVAALATQKTPIVISLMGSDVKAASLLQKSLIFFFIRFSWKEVIVKSNEMKSDLGYSKSHIIPNGVDFKNYRPIDKKEALFKLGWDSSKRHILFSSNPERREKNYQLAESAIKILNNRNIELHFLMNITQKEMPYYYNAADCLLLTSLYEGSPNVIKEAMACNCPIVSTDVGDVRDLIENTKGCYLSKFEVDDLALKINEALSFNQRTKGSDAIYHLDSRIIADKLITIYKRALN
jgi:glycosyltransferase involved in cell wall biosynthesis